MGAPQVDGWSELVDPQPIAYQQCRSILERSLDGHVALYDPINDEVLALDVVGSLIWRMLDEPATMSELVDALAAHFDEVPTRVRRDVEPLLEQLSSMNFVDSIGEAATIDP